MTVLLAFSCFLLLSTAAKGNIGRTLWALCNLLDTLRSLKQVRSNGRKVGVTTRRKLIKQCLVGWIVFVAAQLVGLAADMILFWFPFYNSIKMLVILVLIVWRLQASDAIYRAFIVPVLHRYEKHVDLTILLVHSSYALLAFFFLYLPWQLTRAMLVAVGVAADNSEPAHHPGDDGSSDDGGVVFDTSSHVTAKSKLPAVKQRLQSPRPSRSAPKDTAGSPGGAHAPSKSPGSQSVSQRKAAFERAAREVSEQAGAEKPRRPKTQTAAPRGAAATQKRQAALPIPPVQAEATSSATTRRPADPAPIGRRTTRKPSAVTASKEDLLLALPAPPSSIPFSSHSSVPNVLSLPQPRPAVDVSGGPSPQASGSRTTLAPPSKRGRPPGPEDSGSASDRPGKRAATAKAAVNTRTAKSSTTVAPRTSARTAAPARARVVSGSNAPPKPPTAAIPPAKRTRSTGTTRTASSTTTVAGAVAPTKKTHTK